MTVTMDMTVTMFPVFRREIPACDGVPQLLGLLLEPHEGESFLRSWLKPLVQEPRNHLGRRRAEQGRRVHRGAPLGVQQDLAAACVHRLLFQSSRIKLRGLNMNILVTGAPCHRRARGGGGGTFTDLQQYTYVSKEVGGALTRVERARNPRDCRQWACPHPHDTLLLLLTKH